MNEASVTLQQVLMLARLAHCNTASEIAKALGMSLSSVSQMIDRLHQLELLNRVEMAEDRRRKQIELTGRGKALLHRIHAARSAEYDGGLANLSAQGRTKLRSALERTLQELAATRGTHSPILKARP